jgi:DNA-binding SARP family transcriptional activator
MDITGLIARSNVLPKQASRVLVVAPAGFGKSSLLRQWAQGREALWVTATASPEGKSQLTEALGWALGEVDRPLEALLPKLSGRVLVLDDLQNLVEPEDRQALEILIESSDSFSLALGSRTEPNLAALHRRRVRQELTEVSAAELGFRGPELAQWMAQMLPAPLQPETLALLESRTQGWAAALVLTAQRLAHLPQAQWHAAVDALSGHSQALYDYLASELLETLPVALRQFLLETSVLPWLVPGPENRLFLRELERRRLLLPHERGGFTLHALLTEFLQARFEEERGSAAFRAHCDTQAQALWERGEWESAFRLWWAQGFAERIAAAIDQTQQERYLDYFPWVKLLPLPLLERYPLALRLRAVVAVETRSPDAENILLQAEAALSGEGGRDPQDIHEVQLARVRHYRYQSQWASVLALLDELEPQLQQPSPHRIRLLQERAFYHYAHAELSQAGEILDKALALRQLVGGTPAQQASVLVQRATMTDLWQGNFTRVREAAQQIEALFPGQRPPVILTFLSVLEAEVAFHTEQPERVQLYRQLQTHAEVAGYSTLKRLAQGFLTYEAVRHYEAVRQGEPIDAESIHIDMEYLWLPELLRLYQEREPLETLTVTRPGSCLWWRFTEPLVARGESREALRLLEIAYQVATELGNPYAQMMTCFWWTLTQPSASRIQECLELAQKHHYEEIFLWQPESERVLAQALAFGVLPELTRALLTQKGTIVWCVRGFGGLQVENPQGITQWPRPKARALFALLWLAEGRALLVERVVATLWPDSDEEKGRQSYRTHCTYLRKALGDTCLETTQEKIRLVIPSASFDDRHVLVHAHASDDPLLWEEALAHAGAAEFLPEFAYEDWALPERERLHRLRQELRLRLAQHWLATRRPEPALELCRAVLLDDSLDEDAALTGVMALVARERLGEARSFWERFVEGLAEAGLKPTPGARHTVQKLGFSEEIRLR